MGSYLESAVEADLERVLGELTSLGTALAAKDKDVEAYRREKSRLACPFCGHRNDLDIRICGGCRATLPRQMHQYAGESTLQLGEGGLDNLLVVTEGLQELAQACLDLQSGELDAEGFQELLDTHLEETEEALKGCARVSVPSVPDALTGHEREYSERVERFGHDSMQALESGLELCRQGLHLLGTTADEVDVLVQKRALRMYSEGCQAIWLARQAFETAFSV